MNSLPVEARRDPASYTDPNGYVFWRGQRVYRMIYEERAAFMRAMLADPTVETLLADGRLVGTRIESDGPEGLVLAHETLWPPSYPCEWAPSMLQDAGRLILDVAGRLGATGYALADGHPWNVFFSGPRPVFIDVGSIGPASPTLIWPAQVQFDRFVRYPLHLYAAGLGELARARLQDLALGVSPDLALRALPMAYKLRHPMASAKLLANQTAVALTTQTEQARATKPATQAVPRSVDPALLARVRPGFFAGLRREIEALTPGRGASDWAAYYARCPSMDPDVELAKQAVMATLLAELSPATVLDLGTNTGHYAVMAARAGAKVVALDQDEASVDALYARARAEKLDVLPLVMDLGNPTPATGWCAEQRPDAMERLAGEAVLMLAVIHHLVFTGNASLAQVARLAARATRRHAVIEWIAPDDPMAIYLRRTATKDFAFYTREAFLEALGQAGFTVRPLEPHAPTRQLLLCEKTAGGERTRP